LREISGMKDTGMWSRNLEWWTSSSSWTIDSSISPMVLFLLTGVIIEATELEVGKEEATLW
jgi:hypothetical protein